MTFDGWATATASGVNVLFALIDAVAVDAPANAKAPSKIACLTPDGLVALGWTWLDETTVEGVRNDMADPSSCGAIRNASTGNDLELLTESKARAGPLRDYPYPSRCVVSRPPCVQQRPGPGARLPFVGSRRIPTL